MAWGTSSGDGVQKPWLKNQWQKKTNWAASQKKWQPKWGQKKWEAKRPEPLPTNFHIDKEARYTGTVAGFWKWSGYGFIKPHQIGIAPNDRIFVHWSNIQTEDRYPFLLKGTEVEFGLLKKKLKDNVYQLRAKYVTLSGGSTVCLQAAQDAQHKTFIGDQLLRYTGLLKFYNPKQGYGYIAVDDGFSFSEPVPKELRVEEAEVDAGGKRPHTWFENLNVEFGIFKNKKGHCLAYNMTLPGGGTLARETLENRDVMGAQTFRGQVAYINWKQGWGHITLDQSTKLPASVQSKLTQMHQAAQQKAKPGVIPEKVIYFRTQDICSGCFLKRGLGVSFVLYIDDKGVGASEIH